VQRSHVNSSVGENHSFTLKKQGFLELSLIDAKVKLIEKKIFQRFWIKDSTCKSLHEFSDIRTMNIVFKDVHIFLLIRILRIVFSTQ
jgi:hypothetical protein